jgi:hypothetical protein
MKFHVLLPTAVLSLGTVVGARQGTPPDAPPAPGRLQEMDRLERRLEELLRRLERFDQGGEAGWAGRFPGFEGMERWFEETPLRRLAPLQPGQGSFQSRGSSVRVEQGPDGSVKVAITETEDGDTQTKEYEAESWEDFREKYPDVGDRLGLDLGGGGFSLRWGPDREAFPSFRGPWFDPGFAGPLRNRLPALPEDDQGERLGIYAQSAPPGVVSYLGLEEGVGLLVEEVEEGTLADKLGVERGDLLLRIQGKEVRGAASVRATLEPVPAGETIEVEVARRGRGIVKLSGKKESPPPKKVDSTRRT